MDKVVDNLLTNTIALRFCMPFAYNTLRVLHKVGNFFHRVILLESCHSLRLAKLKQHFDTAKYQHYGKDNLDYVTFEF